MNNGVKWASWLFKEILNVLPRPNELPTSLNISSMVEFFDVSAKPKTARIIGIPLRVNANICRQKSTMSSTVIFGWCLKISTLRSSVFLTATSVTETGVMRSSIKRLATASRLAASCSPLCSTPFLSRAWY